jgi:hypothetical protein
VSFQSKDKRIEGLRTVIDYITHLNDKAFEQFARLCIQRAKQDAMLRDTNPNEIVGSVPIWHKGEATVHDFPDWNAIFDHNTQILVDRYGNKNQKIYGNNGERFVAGKNDSVIGRERARYEWAAKNLVGKKILDIGCSSGYGVRFLPQNVQYMGIDNDERIIEFAKDVLGSEYKILRITNTANTEGQTVDKFTPYIAQVVPNTYMEGIATTRFMNKNILLQRKPPFGPFR